MMPSAEDIERAREAMIDQVNAASDAIRKFGVSMRECSDTITLCAYHHRAAFAWAGRVERLRRQHKAKARGRNWRNVR